MKNTLKLTSKLALVAALGMAFVGCARNLNGVYTGTETVSQGGYTYGNQGTNLNLRVELDEASGQVHGTWESSAATNPADPNTNSMVARGTLTGTRNGDRITDVRLTIFQNNNNVYGGPSIGGGFGTGAWGISAIAAGCGSYVGELSLTDNRLFGTLNAGGGNTTDPYGNPAGAGCTGTRLIEGRKAQ